MDTGIGMTKECIWCSGQSVVCVLCDKEIRCMFCGGSGKFTAEPNYPMHQCKEDRKQCM
jgi:hypothetical protein